MALWNGQDLEAQTPLLGFTLSTATLLPAFIEQTLMTGLFNHRDETVLTPLDDLKEWMRSDPYRTGPLVEDAHALLLGEEDKARKLAEKAGLQFDPVGFELDQMNIDSTFETFDPAWTRKLFELVIEEADALQAWSRKEHGCDFALAASFQLGDVPKHPRFTFEQQAAALAQYGAAKPLVETVMKGRHPKAELSGALQLDLSAKDAPGPVYQRRNGVGFVRVPIADPRAGDETLAHLALAYSLEAEGLFLLHFDALRQDLALKNAAED